MTPLQGLLLTPVDVLAAASSARPFEAVVVGGGPAGITAAVTLAHSGFRIALLELGAQVLLTHALSTDLRFNGGSVRALQRALSYSPKASDGSNFGALIACLGGRGMFWNGAAPRYLPADFAGWPITYDEVEPFYRWVERELFVTTAWGRTALAECLRRILRRSGSAAEPAPLAIDSEPSMNGWLSGTIGNPVTPLLRSGLLAPDVERRLFVATEVFARRIERPSGQAPVEVIARDRRSGQDHVIAGRSVVLAAGGFGSVRIAMASGLPDESGFMGRRLWDHWFVRGYFPLPPELYDPTRPEAGALLVRPQEGQPFQVELHLPGRLFFQAHAQMNWRPAPNDTYSAMIRAFAPTQRPETSRIEITDPDVPEGYTVHIETTDADLALRATMVEGLRRMRDALGAGDAQIDQYPLGASYHEAGGLAMAREPAAGVVDPFGRFFGDRRVVVVDASAWPSIGTANPHITVVALARRQAGRLAEDLQTGSPS